MPIEQVLFNLGSAVGGIAGLLAVLIYVQSRKDAAAANASYERLVVRMAEQSEKSQEQLVAVVANNTTAMQMQTRASDAMCVRFAELEREVMRRNHERS